MPSGGRRSTTWGPGNAKGAGRKQGSKDEIPRSVKASLRAVYQEIVNDDPEILKTAVTRGLLERNSKARFPYVRLFAELYGELKQQVELSGAVTVSDEQLGDIRQQLDQLAAKYAAGGVVKAGVAE